MVKQPLFIYLIAGWAGYLVMSVEILGGKLLAPYFGSGVHVWGALISVFMLALAVGYLVGGQYSRSAPSLGRLCLILATAALTLLPGILLAEPILEGIFAAITDPRYGALLAATALLFLPIAIAGAVSPYALRLLQPLPDESGQIAGWVMFIGTFGSMTGTLLTAFYWVTMFDIDTLLYGMIAASLALAATGWWSGRRA